jgi:hypothetical protein
MLTASIWSSLVFSRFSNGIFHFRVGLHSVDGPWPGWWVEVVMEAMYLILVWHAGPPLSSLPSATEPDPYSMNSYNFMNIAYSEAQPWSARHFEVSCISYSCGLSTSRFVIVQARMPGTPPAGATFKAWTPKAVSMALMASSQFIRKGCARR